MKTWKPGVADEAWKQAICDRDIKMINDTLSFLAYVILDDPKDQNPDRAASELSKLSGAEIVTALQQYRASSQKSIANG